jgi:hypothetical protein
MAAALDDALLGLQCAKQRAVNAAAGSGRVRQIDRDLTAAVSAISRQLQGRILVDLSDVYALVDLFAEAGGDLAELARAVDQRRFIDRQERQAP